jgi:hypothetical protein
MNLHKINHCISVFKSIINKADYDGWNLWELVHQFQTNWDIDSSDFAKMFEKSFQINSPLWVRDSYYPKEAMQHYIKLNDDLVRAMFRDLFNESKDISGRIGRFSYQCDELYKLDRQSNDKVKPHYHSDKKMIFLYLAFRYPEIYLMLDFESFKKFMILIESKNTPIPEDLDRYIKVANTLKGLLLKDPEFIAIVKSKVTPALEENIYPMILIYELYQWVDRY